MLPERHVQLKQSNFAEFSRRYEAMLGRADGAPGLGLPELFRELLQYLRELFEFNFVHYSFHDGSSDAMRIFVVDENGLVAGDPT
jgi:hypothetical protein